MINNYQTTVKMPNTLKPSQLLLENVQVKIGGSRTIQQKGLKQNYVVYKLTTSPYDWEVERRFNDFCWLRDMMFADFPFTFVPQIPEKEMHNKDDASIIIKRRNWLQKFLDSIVDHPE